MSHSVHRPLGPPSGALFNAMPLTVPVRDLRALGIGAESDRARSECGFARLSPTSRRSSGESATSCARPRQRGFLVVQSILV